VTKFGPLQSRHKMALPAHLATRFTSALGHARNLATQGISR
jgi:hypothetical protein